MLHVRIVAVVCCVLHDGNYIAVRCIRDFIEQRTYVLRIRIVTVVCCMLHGRSFVAVHCICNSIE